jgi:hypothetical protein
MAGLRRKAGVGVLVAALTTVVVAIFREAIVQFLVWLLSRAYRHLGLEEPGAVMSVLALFVAAVIAAYLWGDRRRLRRTIRRFLMACEFDGAESKQGAKELARVHFSLLLVFFPLVAGFATLELRKIAPSRTQIDPPLVRIEVGRSMSGEVVSLERNLRPGPVPCAFNFNFVSFLDITNEMESDRIFVDAEHIDVSGYVGTQFLTEDRPTLLNKVLLNPGQSQRLQLHLCLCPLSELLSEVEARRLLAENLVQLNAEVLLTVRYLDSEERAGILTAYEFTPRLVRLLKREPTTP